MNADDDLKRLELKLRKRRRKFQLKITTMTVVKISRLLRERHSLKMTAQIALLLSPLTQYMRKIFGWKLGLEPTLSTSPKLHGLNPGRLTEVRILERQKIRRSHPVPVATTTGPEMTGSTTAR